MFLWRQCSMPGGEFLFRWGYFWLAFNFVFLYNNPRNHAERWQSGNAADC